MRRLDSEHYQLLVIPSVFSGFKKMSTKLAEVITKPFFLQKVISYHFYYWSLNMELIRNGGFEADPPLQHWYGTAESSSTAHSGSRSAQFIDGISWLQQDLVSPYERAYSRDGAMSFWARNLSDGISYVHVQVLYKIGYPSSFTSFELPPESEWQSFTVDLSRNTPLRTITFFSANDCLIDDVSIEGVRFYVIFATLRLFLDRLSHFFERKRLSL